MHLLFYYILGSFFDILLLIGPECCDEKISAKFD